MSVQVRRRREAAGFLASFVGAQGELIVDTTNNRVQVHDGATPGGFAAAKLSEVAVLGGNGALAVGQGGTGATTAAAARTALGGAASGVNGDITQLTNLATDLSVAQGGTGASTAVAARANLGAAASGTNADIAALSGLTAAAAFTPTIGFVTNGDLAVAYSTQTGLFYRIGKLTFVSIQLVFVPTYTSAAGAFRLSGLPDVGASGAANVLAVAQLSGSTAIAWPASATMLSASVTAGQSTLTLVGQKSSAVPTAATTGQFVSGNTITLSVAGTFLAG